MDILPTEIWFEIASFSLFSSESGFEYASICSLAQTCHHLHDICRSFIQDHMHEKLKKSVAPIVVCPLLEEMTPVERLRVETLLDKLLSSGRSFQLLRFEIAHDDDITTIRPIQYFISHTKFISTIEIELHGRLGDAVPSFASLLNLCVKRTQNLHVREWSEVETGSKKTLRRYQGRAEHGPFNFACRVPRTGSITKDPVKERETRGRYINLSNLLSGSFRSMRRVRRGEFAPFPPPGFWMIESRTPRHNVTLPPDKIGLETFDLSVDELFSASMYPWTHRLLNASRLKHLIISVKLTSAHWEHILPTVYLPNLDYLSLLDIPIPFPHLLAFLNRHSSLRTLEIINSNETPCLDVEFPEDYRHPAFLPSFERLIATPRLILPFFMHNKRGFFPKLTTYDLRSCFYDLQTTSCLTAAWGRRLDRIECYESIFKELASTSCQNAADLGHPEKERDKKIHLKLYTMAITALVEWFTAPPEGPGHVPSKVFPIDNVQTVTIVYPHGWTPPSLAMHLIRPWVYQKATLAKAIEQARLQGLFEPPKPIAKNSTPSLEDEEMASRVRINMQKDVWLLNLFLCCVFPDLERIISEYRGYKHDLKVDKSLFECRSQE